MIQSNDLLQQVTSILPNMFENAKQFSLYIEKVVLEKNITHMDAVLEYCKDNFIDPQDVSKLINKSLRDKIRVNATELNYFPKQATLDL